MNPSVFPLVLAQVKLEDVFKSAQENMRQSPASSHLMVFFLGALAIVILLLILHQSLKRAAVLKPVNHQGRLLKEISRLLQLKPAEVRQLKRLAEQESCSSPLTLLLCPSLLAKAVKQCPAPDRKALDKILHRATHQPPPPA